MPETTNDRITPWMEEPGKYEQCVKCRKTNYSSYGVMLRRRLFDREGTMHSEYKIVCKNCNRSTGAHRSKLLTEKEWEAKQDPEDELKYRNRNPKKPEDIRTPNIASYREAEK